MAPTICRSKSNIGVKGCHRAAQQPRHQKVPPTTLAATHPLLLHFTDPALEDRYCCFQFGDGSFIAGKLFALMWVGLGGANLLLHPAFSGGPLPPFSVAWWCSFLLVGTVIGCSFVNSMAKFRELLHHAQVFLGWPVHLFIILTTSSASHPPHIGGTSPLGLILGCACFCLMMVPSRLFRCLPFVTLWPLICLSAISASMPGFWDHRSKVEVAHWATLLFIPLPLAWVVERHTRTAFVERERALGDILLLDGQLKATTQAIARWCPSTGSRTLMEKGERSYTDAALIATEVASFSSFVASNNPAGVVQMLAQMLRVVNAAAHAYGVEGLVTVGDTYLGGILTGPTANRCTRMISFACSTIELVKEGGPELRVGVHIGEFVGAFVGRAPPRFDVFGAGVDHTKVMLRAGRVGYAHVSHSIRILACHEWGDVGQGSITPHGVLMASCPSKCCTLRESVVNRSRDGDALNIDERAAGLLCRSSADLSSVELHECCSHPPTTQQPHQQLANEATPLSGNEAHEEEFQLHIERMGVSALFDRLFATFSFALLSLQVSTQCGTPWNLRVASAMLLVQGAFAFLIHLFSPAQHRLHATATFVAYNVVMVISMLGPSHTCKKAEGAAAACFLCLALMAPQFCLGVGFSRRCAMAAVTCVAWVACVRVLDVSHHPNEGHSQSLYLLSLLGPVFVLISYCVDLPLRRAFRMLIIRQQKSCQAKALAASVLRATLPAFAVGHISNAGGEEMLSLVPPFIADVSNIASVWEYPHAIVVAVTIEPLKQKLDVDTTVRALEMIADRFLLRKATSNGLTIMFIAGVDGDVRSSRQDLMESAVEAALHMHRWAHHHDTTALTIAVHRGPCMVTVVGLNCDLLGDTIDSAIHLASTCRNGVFMSSAACSLLPTLPPYTVAICSHNAGTREVGGDSAVYKASPNEHFKGTSVV